MKKSVSKAGKGQEVHFELAVKPGSQVFIAGTFNEWNRTAHPMKDNPGSGHCKAALRLQPGRHEYKFIVNGEWRTDPNCIESVPNREGTLNSVISV